MLVGDRILLTLRMVCVLFGLSGNRCEPGGDQWGIEIEGSA